MQYINRLNNAAYQQSFLTGNPGQRIVMTVRYMPSQQLWLMDISYNDFNLYGIPVLFALNMLRNYNKLIPFGIGCTTTDGQDPYSIEDFASGYAKLYLLSAEECQAVEAEFYT